MRRDFGIYAGDRQHTTGKVYRPFKGAGTQDIVFYVLAPRNEFETFLFFQTADQLERIILGTIAENVEIIMEAGIEEMSIGFSADKMDGEYGKSIEHYLPGLVHKLDVICKTGEEWQNMMRVTFNSLKNVCAEIAEKEQKNV